MPIYHSLPGALKIIYLNFVGGNVTGTAWNTAAKVGTFVCLPYDPSGTPGYTAAEQTAIGQIWARVAEDYSPWNVDVTTERPTAFGPFTGHIMVTRSIDATGVGLPASAAGGVAYVNVFGILAYR